MTAWPHAPSLRLWLFLTGAIVVLVLAFIVVAVGGGLGASILGDLYWWSLTCLGLLHVASAMYVIRRHGRGDCDVGMEWVVAAVVYTGVEAVLVMLFLAWLARPFPV